MQTRPAVTYLAAAPLQVVIYLFLIQPEDTGYGAGHAATYA